jgi:hypothetical protein
MEALFLIPFLSPENSFFTASVLPFPAMPNQTVPTGFPESRLPAPRFR